MAESNIADLSTDNKIDLLIEATDRLEAQYERVAGLLEDLSEKLDNLNLSGDGFDVEDYN